MCLENRVLATLFLLSIFAFGITSIFRWSLSPQTVSSDEKRRFAPLPHLNLDQSSILAFPHGFEAFYNDRFACRIDMVKQLNKAKYSICGISGTPRVLVGRKHWLFYLDQGDTETMRHFPLFDNAELLAWSRRFEARRAWLGQHGIRYLVFIAPSKCEIYPEFVPEEYGPLQRQSRQDQLLHALEHYTHVQFLDLRKPLRSAKSNFPYPLYYKTDTHWNTIGSFISYRHIAERLSHFFPTFKPRGWSDMEISTVHHSEGDLANMMGLRGEICETVARANNKCSFRWRLGENPPITSSLIDTNSSQFFVTKLPDSHLPRLFVLGDSFMDLLQPLLSEHFSQASYYYWPSNFPLALIDKQKPDIVLEEIAERSLNSSMVSNPIEVDAFVRINTSAQEERKTDFVAGKSVITH